MISFANPQYFYLLLLIPALAGLYVLSAYIRRKKLNKFGHPEVIASLMPDSSKYMPSVKIVIELLALFFIVVALARPYTRNVDLKDKEEETVSGIEVMICFDVSNSMLASSTQDPGGISRLQRSKYILEKTIDQLGDDKVGLIVFAGEAYTQLPITPDFISAKMFVNDINTEMVPTQGTAIGTAIDMAINSFTPDSDFQRAIILITDGENFEDDAVEEAKRAAEAGIQVDVIGVGSTNGTPIPLKPGSSEYMTDHNGERVMTHLDEETCKEIAKAGDGIYINGSSSSAVSDLKSQLKKLATTEYRRATMTSAAGELFFVPIWIALILLLIDTLLPYSKIPILRNINFFSKSQKKE